MKKIKISHLQHHRRHLLCFQKEENPTATWKGRLQFPSIPPWRCHSEQHFAVLCKTEQNIACLFVSQWPGKSVPLSRTHWDMQAVCSTSPNHNPRLQPPRDALHSPVLEPLVAFFCQPGFATSTLQTEHALFSVNTTNRRLQPKIHESYLCHT